MTDKNLIMSVAGLLVVIGAVFYVISGGATTPAASNSSGVINLPAVTASSSPVAQFAQCLKDKGVTFYGAFWCPHCQAQKALFGDAVPYLPYVECSTPDKNAQTQICINKKIEGYPTWEFLDGSRLTGERTFKELGEKANCPIPASK